MHLRSASFFLSILLPILGSTATADRLPVFPNEQLPVTIRSVLGGKCLDVRAAGGDGAELQQYTCGEQENQTWWLTWAGGSDYALRPGHLGNIRLGIAGESIADGAVARMVNGDFASAQFQFVRQSDGNYTIINKRSGKCLDVPWANPADGVTIMQYGCHGGTNQRWKIVPRARPLHIASAATGRCLDVGGASLANLARIQQYDCLGTQQDNQEFLALRINNTGFYQLRASHSGKCLSTQGKYLTQASCSTNLADQRFTMNPDASGDLEIRSASNFCVEIYNGDPANGTPVMTAACTGASNQRFNFRRAIRRHVLVVQPATIAGADRYTANPSDIAFAVARANDVYRPHGVELLFDPASDVLDLESDALHALGEDARKDDLLSCETLLDLDTPARCGDRIGALFPDRVVLMIGPGAMAGYSSGRTGFVFVRPGLAPNQCGTSTTGSILPHELGHYFGLGHVMVGFPDATAAGNAWLARGDAAFDGDLLADTAPDPLIGNGTGCLSPLAPSAFQWLNIPPTPPLHLTQIAYSTWTDQVMSYYANATPRITPQQAAIVRAGAYARGL